VIEYQLPGQAFAKLEIYNLRGELIRQLVQAQRPAGYHEVIWDGRDEHGNPVSSGIYFLSMQADEYRSIIKMSLAK
jgi:flagellar hook assembly protein FlgD